ISHNPTSDFRSPKVKKTPPHSIPPEAIERLLAEPGKSTTPKALRDSALLEILYATGMRVSELVGLNVADLDMEQGTVVCGVQSNRQRVISIRPETQWALGEYLHRGRQAL